MSPLEAREEIRRQAVGLGFDAVGVATLEPSRYSAQFDQWLGAGMAGEMSYMRRQAAKRREPHQIRPEAKAAVVTLSNYYHGASHSPLPTPRIAQYAWSEDYHRVLGRRLDRLAAVIRDVVPGSRTWPYVDAGPVPERELAQRAGLGWIAKNTMLIHPELGSFTFIGVVLTDAALPPDSPFEADRCGSCTRCLEACPTGAFPEPRVLDARRCISYLTIEKRGAFSTEESAMVGEWLFGCDVCQDVCPWNVSFAEVTQDAEFEPVRELQTPSAEIFRHSTPDTQHLYARTALERAGPEGMRRNADAVLKNLSCRDVPTVGDAEAAGLTGRSGKSVRAP
jgi:epoxyqueuosine reductase